MKKVLFLLLCCVSSNMLFAEHKLELGADFLYLGRDLCDEKDIGDFDRDPHSGYFKQKWTTTDVARSLKHVPALRVKGLILADRREGFELRYLGLVNFSGNAEISSTDDITFPFKNVVTTDWIAADRAKAWYDSRFYSFDASYINFIIPKGERYFGLNWGVGIDYAEINEKFKLRYYNDSQSSKYDITATNTLMGAHLMGEFSCHPYRVISWGVQLRVGVYADVIGIHQLLNDDDEAILMMNRSKHGIHPTYSGEIYPYIAFEFLPILRFTVAYNWIYYRDIALAPEQVNDNPSSSQRINHQGHENYRGFGAGLTLKF